MNVAPDLDALSRVAATLRYEQGWTFRKIGQAIGVSEANAWRLAHAGGWEPAKWPLTVTRIPKQGLPYVVRGVMP